MVEVSRTARVIQNAKIALIFYCLILVLQFFSRKVFLDCLGSELLGLNTTAQTLLQFLNLAESGIGAAVAFALYKPLNLGNRQEINEILSVQGWFYRRVGIAVLFGSVVLMLFFPLIFCKAKIPLIFSFVTYIVFLIGALLSYFINYNIVLLSADQKEYLITIPTQGVRVLKVIVQIFVVWKLAHGYVWWLVVEVLSAFITSVIMLRVMKHEYPWLKSNITLGKNIRWKYSFLLTKTKQLFFHKIGGYVLTQTTPLVIYAFSTLTTVAIYGNYWVIVLGCVVFMDALSRGFNASVGNLVAEGDKSKIKIVFWEILTFKIFLAGGICYGIVCLSESFICLWVGHEYVMDRYAMIIMTAIYFIHMHRTSDIFLSAYGLFSDIWAPIIQSALSLFFSVTFGYFWGLVGIFIGVLIAQIIIVNTWKVLFLYKRGFNESIREYLIKYTVKIILLCLVYFLITPVINVFIFQVSTLFDWIKCAMLYIAFYVVSAGCLFYIFDSSFRSLVKRFIKVIV